MLHRTATRRLLIWLSPAVVCILAVGVLAVPARSGASNDSGDPFTTTFHLEQCTWIPTGGNLYFSLDPGTQHVLEGEEDGEPSKVVITVLRQIKWLDGVIARVIEERHFVNDELVEISRNFYSLCHENDSVFYFGEEVDFYEDRQIIGHEGAWLAGVDGAEAGLYMPALPLLGARYYQEIAPGAALDRAEVVSLTESADVPVGSFAGCLKTIETTPLEPGAEGVKLFCPEIGIVNDDGLLLVSYTAGTPGFHTFENIWD